MVRPLAMFILGLGLLLVFARSHAQPTSKDPVREEKNEPTKAEKNSYLADLSLLQRGYKMLKDQRLSISPTIDFRPTFQAVFAPRVGLVNLEIHNLVNLSSMSKEYEELTARQGRETNELLKSQIDVQRRQLEVLLEQAKLQAAQNQLGEASFEYTKRRDDSLLRRLDYALPAKKLVVVVADFSSGGSGEGTEIADEIASALYELKEKAGLDFEILVGEVRPDRPIRSERMAQDVGQHFPKGTCYAVVWGSLSPRTVGKFRPHVTCVFKVDDHRGVSQSFTINPDSQELPRGDTAEDKRRDQHTQLVAFTCAVIPGCYASYALAREEHPVLDRFYAYLKEAAPDRVERYKAELAPLMKWVDYRDRLAKANPRCQLRRVTTISAEFPLPRVLSYAADNSLMTLITDRGKDGVERPHRFKDKDGEYVVYIDQTEATNRQFLAFLNERGNGKVGGVPLIAWPTASRFNILQDEGSQKWVTGKPQEDLERPVINVSWYGAREYCAWAGKNLPTVEEWRAATEGEPGWKYTWGDAADPLAGKCANGLNAPELFPTRRVGSYATTDRSRIGCLDMAGNVSEWCEDNLDPARGVRAVCGGNYQDKDPGQFLTTRSFEEPAASHFDWIGFRGVVRIRLDP